MNSQVRSFVVTASLGLCLLLLFPVFAAAAEADRGVEGKETLAIGSGQILEGNVARAKEVALANALEKGFEAYLTRRLGRQGMIDNFQILVNELLPRSGEAIENFLILTESQTDKGLTVLVRLKVNDKMMDERFREMGLVLREGPPVKVLFLVSHHDLIQDEVSYWWGDPDNPIALTLAELSLRRVFEARGFNPINRMFSVPGGGVTEEMKILDLSEGDALGWGAMYGADVVISGRCEILEENVVSVSLSALSTRAGIKVLQDSQSEGPGEAAGIVEEVSTVIDRAVTKVAARMGPGIIRAMEAEEATTKSLEITLEGLRSFKEFNAFKLFLDKEIRGVKAVRQTRVRGSAMSIMVEFSGDEAAFLDMVTRHKNLPLVLEEAGREEGTVVFNVR